MSKIGDCFQSTVMGVGILASIDEPSATIQFGSHRSVTKLGQFGGFEPVPTLHLPIGNDAKKYGGAWFDLILSGVKKEEYREIWGQSGIGRNIATLTTTNAKDAKAEFYRIKNEYGDGALPIFADHLMSHCLVSMKVLHLTNGYGHDKPQLWAHIESITIGRGKPEWGAPTDRDVFIIKLGEVFHSKNLKP